MLKFSVVLLIAVTALFPCRDLYSAPSHDADRSYYGAPMARIAPVVDASGDDPAWERAEWRPIDKVWLGSYLSEDDFQGRFKLTWTSEKLYVLVELTDDVLVDFHREPLDRYWDDDCLELFIDEDHSGGNHQYNHNAFAYHVSLDNQVVDIGTDTRARTYNDHVESQWRQQDGIVVWELAVSIYTDEYQDNHKENKTVELKAGKVMGFMVAYRDNDHSEIREHFIGSEDAGTEHTDRGWIDASMFGTLELVQ